MKAGTRGGRKDSEGVNPVLVQDVEHRVIPIVPLQFLKYAKLARYDIKVDGRTYVISLYHAMGIKWSMFLRGCFEEAIPASWACMESSKCPATWCY